MSKVALITGITGQDGSYLAEFYWRRVTRFTVLYVVLPFQILPVSII